MTRCITLLLLVLQGYLAFSVTCDSVPTRANTIPFATADERGRHFIEEGIRLANSDQPEFALELFDEAILILEDSVQLVRAACLKGLLLCNLDRYYEVLDVLVPFLPFCERSRPFLEPTYLNWIIEGVYDCLAGAYLFTGNYRLAIQSAQTSLELGELFPDKANFQNKYIDFGLIYYKLRDYGMAAEMYRKAATYAKRENGKLSLIYANFAACYSEMDSLDLALKYADSTDRSCNGGCSPRQVVFNHFNYGMIYLKMKLFGSARRHFETSLRYSRHTNFMRMVADNLTYRARVHIATQQYDSASYDLVEAERIAIAENLNENLLDIYRQSVILYAEMRDYVRLSHYQQKLMTQKQMVHQAELARDMTLMEWRMAEAANMQKRSLQQKEILARNEILTYQERLAWLGGLVVLLVLLLITIILYQYFQQKKVHQILAIRVKQRSDVFVQSENAIQVYCTLLLGKEHDLRDRIRVLTKNGFSGVVYSDGSENSST